MIYSGIYTRASEPTNLIGNILWVEASQVLFFFSSNSGPFGFQIILLFLCSRELQWKRTLNEFHMGLKKKKQNNKSKPWNNSQPLTSHPNPAYVPVLRNLETFVFL